MLLYSSESRKSQTFRGFAVQKFVLDFSSNSQSTMRMLIYVIMWYAYITLQFDDFICCQDCADKLGRNIAAFSITSDKL